MSLALYFKCQLDPYCNFAERKCKEHKTPKLIIATTLISCQKREKHNMKNEFTALACQKEIKCHEKKEWADIDLDIIFLVFCCGPCTCLFTGSVFFTAS